MVINIIKGSNTLVLTIKGKVDENTIKVLKNVIKDYRGKYKNIEIDMKNMEYISEKGIEQLRNINDDVDNKWNIKLINISEGLRNELENAGFLKKQFV